MRILLFLFLLLSGCGPNPQVQFQQARPALEAALATVQAEPGLREVILMRDGERRLNGIAVAPEPDTVMALMYVPRQPEREVLSREGLDPEHFRVLVAVMDTSAISRVWRGRGFIAFTTGGWIDAEVGFLWAQAPVPKESNDFDQVVQVGEEWYWYGVD